jgi:iron(III) transport system substrate-binding protein
MLTTRRSWFGTLAALSVLAGAGTSLAAAPAGTDTTTPDTAPETTDVRPEAAELPDLSGESLTVYSGRDEELIQPVIDVFAEATGADVEVRYGSSAEMGAALMEEGDRTPADVFYSQEVGALGMLAKEGLLAELPDTTTELVDERFRPAEGTDWVGVTGRSRVIVYNRDLVEEPPAGVLELTDPAYEGQVAIVPGNAGFQAFVTAFRVSEGEDEAREWLEAMQDNGVVTDIESNGDVLAAVERGDIEMGLINHYYWARTLEETGGAEERAAQLVFPTGDDPGGLVNATAVGITVSGEDNPAAQAFVDFLLSVEGQTYFATETFEYPLVEGVDDPEGVPPLEDLQGPPLDLTDLDSLQATQDLLTELGLLS